MVALYVCPKRMDDEIHSEHSYLEMLANRYAPPELSYFIVIRFHMGPLQPNGYIVLLLKY